MEPKVHVTLQEAAANFKTVLHAHRYPTEPGEEFHSSVYEAHDLLFAALKAEFPNYFDDDGDDFDMALSPLLSVLELSIFMET